MRLTESLVSLKRTPLPFSISERKELKAHLVRIAKRDTLRRLNTYNKKRHPKRKMQPTLHVSKEGTALLKRANKECPALVAELRAKIKEYNRKLRNRRAGAAVSATKSKIDPVKTRIELTKVADSYDKEEASVVDREMAQRTLARKHLIASVIRFNPAYLAGWVHKDICARLERFMTAVENGENPRLMLQMPPRHGKSTLASQEFPAWVLGHHPTWELIVCSYAETLALDFSRAVRERMRDPEFQVLFPTTKMDRDNQNAKGWKLTKKGGFLPAGVEGPITGKGAHILIIDDPIKNSQEAEYLSFRLVGTWTICQGD